MKLMKSVFCLVSLVLLLVGVTAQAEQKITRNGFEIHYSAIPSSFITPEVASAYQLERSRVKGLLNVAVLKINSDGSTTPVTAIVSGEAKNLVQQIRELEFTKVTEGEAIYYISTFRYSNEERLDFTLEVQPNPNDSPIEVKFTQTFYEG